MNANLRSMLAGTAGLSAAALLALLLTILRRPAGDVADYERTGRLFLIGVGAQCLHLIEECVTRFQDRFPELLGLPPWPKNFFVVFNLIWLSVWTFSAIGLQRRYRFALFPVWFFAIAAIVNGVAHPVLAFMARGYFPGLELLNIPPRLFLAAPALDFHPSNEAVLRFLSPEIEVERVGVGIEWRRELKVMFRSPGKSWPLRFFDK